MSDNKVVVNIHGVKYTLLTDESEDKIKEIAKYVEQKIDEVKNQKLSYDRELVLTSINIAYDLFNVGNKYNKLRDDSSEAVENYYPLIEKYEKAIDQNEELVAKVEEVIEKNQELTTTNNNLSKKIESIEGDDNSLEKLREEIARLQREIITLKSENAQLKENI